MARHAVAQTSLTALLERYCREGYDPEMKTALMQAVNGHLRHFSLDGVQVLPGDLDEVLESFGNPLVDEDAEGTAGLKPAFDVNNPEQRAALHQRIIEASQWAHYAVLGLSHAPSYDVRSSAVRSPRPRGTL